MTTVILVMLWLTTVSLAYYIGKHTGTKQRKPSVPVQEVPLTKEEQLRIERERRENKNFWDYDGTPQSDTFQAN